MEDFANKNLWNFVLKAHENNLGLATSAIQI